MPKFVLALTLAAIPALLAPAASAQFNGWTVGDNGTILHTSDGGATWSPQTSGTSNFPFGVDFVDQNNGWVVGVNGTILHTTNGGATWLPQNSGTGSILAGVSFVDANNGWTVGPLGTILHTSDGGATWSPQTSGVALILFRVKFVDTNNGWVVGQAGVILQTTNGGVSWAPQSSGASGALEDVTFVDANNGWAVGDNGVIVHTSDGGATWSPQSSGTRNTLISVSFPRGGTAAKALDIPFQSKIFPNLPAGDSLINIGNTGASAALAMVTAVAASPFAIGGNLCVNVYVFSADEQEVACCTCFVTPNGVVTTSARQLISKTLTPAVPTAVTVKLVATDGTAGAASCNAATPGAIASGLIAFGTNIHAAPVGGSNSAGTFAVTETPFIPATLSAAELTRISTLCGFIQSNGTGFGLCPGCTAGAAGAVRK